MLGPMLRVSHLTNYLNQDVRASLKQLLQSVVLQSADRHGRLRRGPLIHFPSVMHFFPFPVSSCGIACSTCYLRPISNRMRPWLAIAQLRLALEPAHGVSGRRTRYPRDIIRTAKFGLNSSASA